MTPRDWSHPNRRRGDAGRRRRDGTTVTVAAWLPSVAGLLLATIGCGSDGGEERTGPPLNVLLISIDTLRADHLSAYGYERLTSPHIDRLAERGVLFREAYSHAPCTAPSHMSLFTSVYPEAHGVRQWQPTGNQRLQEEIPTLASVLHDAGYTTAAYTGGGNVRPELGFDVGFDVYETHGHRVDDIFERSMAALDTLAATPESRPFLLFVHTFAVHDPYIPPEQYKETFSDGTYRGDVIDSVARLGVATNFDRSKRSDVFWEHVDAERSEDLQRIIDLYDACILHADELIGRLLERLESSGLADSTLVVFTADHGEEFLEHGAFKHSTTYQELLHVPLIIAHPAGDAAAPRGATIDGVVRQVDVMPTILDIVGVETPADVQGRSLVPRMASPSSVRGEPVVVSQWMRGRFHSVRVGDWKLIHQYVSDQLEPVEELYDLSTDPGERNNLVDEHPERASQLRARLEAEREAAQIYYLRRGHGDTVELEDSTRSQLEALGYLGK